MSAREAIARRTLRDARTRTIAFVYVFAIYAYVQPAGFRGTYPTLADRIAFAHSFAGNAAIRVFYGYPFNPVTIGGYSAWRVGGTLAIVAAVFGVLAAVRALRAEEDDGRTEMVLAMPISRLTTYWSVMAGISLTAAILWVALFAGFAAGGLAIGGSAYLALAIVAVVPVFIGVGAIASQLAPTRRLALELGCAFVALSLMIRVIADTATGAGWLRWVTPLGWAEQLRPFTGTHPLPLLLVLAASAGLIGLAARMASGRDIGTGTLRVRDTARPRLRLLSGPLGQALRADRSSLIVWSVCFALFAVVLGAVAPSISSAGISPAIRRSLAKLGTGSILSPSGYISFVFIFFIFAVAMFVCAQVGSARHEESEERLETLLALPVGRTGWLSGRLLLSAAGAIGLALIAGVVTWAGASAEGVNVSLARMIEAGANCLPVAALFLGIAALAYALAPRASTGISYGIVSLSFLWYLVGSIAGVPKWLVKATPFAHIGFVPTQPFRTVAAIVMVAAGLLAVGAALTIFRRRDLLGA